MFTVESQTTRDRRGGTLGSWFFDHLSSFGSGPQSLALRIKRRTDWFTTGLTTRKGLNVLSAIASFAAKREKTTSWPVFVVIDISPLCNLHCTVCLHAHPNGNPDLLRQEFHNRQRMSVAQYRRIVNEIKDHSLGVLLYYLGDPLMHPDLTKICRITHEAGLNSQVSTNFSFALSDKQIHDLVASGLTHLTVCVDGSMQETYQRTRVGGRLELVVSNLRRACEYRRATGRRFPRIEVQYIKYQHNLGELEEAHRLFGQLGVDQVHEMWGWLHNYTDRDPGKYAVRGPRRKKSIPWCHWPHLFTVIKYDGDVLPCCAFRLGHQYTHEEDPRALGNVFDTSLWNVWTSSRYRAVRRFACNPEVRNSDPSLAGNFCDSCPRLFESDYEAETCRFANEYAYEDLYTIGKDGRPVRRRERVGSLS